VPPARPAVSLMAARNYEHGVSSNIRAMIADVEVESLEAAIPSTVNWLGTSKSGDSPTAIRNWHS
jgi:hypothetical protein